MKAVIYVPVQGILQMDFTSLSHHDLLFSCLFLQLSVTCTYFCGLFPLIFAPFSMLKPYLLWRYYCLHFQAALILPPQHTCILFTLTRNLLSSVPPAPPFAAPLNLLSFSVLYTDFHSSCLSLPFLHHLDPLPVHVLILTNELCSFSSAPGTPP